MRTVLLICLVITLGIPTIYSQQINSGAHFGLPVGNASESSRFALSLDLYYLFELSESFRLGAGTGYTHTFGDFATVNGFTVEADDVQYIPLAASFRFDLPSNVCLGSDIGYGIGVNQDNSGGIYFSPRVQYRLFGPVQAVLAYRGLYLDNGSWDLISLGLEFTFY